MALLLAGEHANHHADYADDGYQQQHRQPENVGRHDSRMRLGKAGTLSYLCDFQIPGVNMHRIDTSTAQKDKFGAGKNGFTGGNPQTGELPTALDQDFFDSIQEEISTVIESAGIELAKSDNGQLLSAIMKIMTKDGSALPVGVPVPWPTSTPPTGWITMSGQTITQAQYPKLFAAYGTKLPDLRGMFIRGWDNGRGLDPSRALLNEQLPTGIRQFTGNNDVQFQGLGITQLINADGNDGYDSGWAVARNANQTTNSSGAGVSFVRPRNVSFNYIVRAA